jgi:PRTRC genetic system protein F|uniref:PRTRC system protein F n=1 Tax=Dechloromonas aromatica (strain RCB) TaxID=159087 RepID=Q47D09_DECAR
MMALVLPRIGPQVPRSIAPGPLLAANAMVSRFLIEAEAFDEADIPVTWSDSLDACRQALDGWLKCQIGALHCLTPRFALHMVSRDGESYRYYGSQPPKDFDFNAVEASWCEYHEQEWPVGAGLEALSARLHGLGTVVLHVLCRQSAFVYPLFTPDIACDVATYLYWCGEDDEEAALDMNCGEDEEEREAMRAEMVTKSMLEASFPAWTRRWPRGLELAQCARFLRRATNRLSDPGAKATAEDALALATLEIDDSFRPDMEGEFVGFGAVLSWRDGDVTTRIYDDLLELAHQGEYCEHMGEVQVPLDDPAAFGAWQQAMASRFAAIRLIDRLIHHLSAGN